MGSETTHSVRELLAALVRLAHEQADATALLHADAVLHRLDGERLEGRAEIVDAICTRGIDTSLRVLAERVDSVVVALEVRGIPGHLPFELRGRAREGVLVELWMDVVSAPDGARR